ncbi:MAG: lysophospholipid acyltransferase family protein [Endomicrobiia bacterium]|nr:lysophospholipid acyltransferase family protein [Endomicrobiia bacterium]
MPKKIFYYFLYLILRVVSSAILLFSLSSARVFGRWLGVFAWSALRIRRREVISRVAAAFPDISPAEAEKIARESYIQFMVTMAELVYFPNLTVEDINLMTDIVGLDLVKKLAAEKRGAVFVSGHFGNWELMGAALTKHIPVNFLVGKQENAPADRMLNDLRRGKDIKIIPLDMALKNVLRALKSGEIVCMLSDQDAREHGVFVNFLGKVASTPKGPATFALKTGMPLVTGFIIRDSSGRFKIHFAEIERPPDGLPTEDAVKIFTQSYTRRLEEFVRKRPDHWFWLHRRWKTDPSVPCP